MQKTGKLYRNVNDVEHSSLFSGNVLLNNTSAKIQSNTAAFMQFLYNSIPESTVYDIKILQAALFLHSVLQQ